MPQPALPRSRYRINIVFLHDSQALALGADAVLLGRPVLYALALDGESGVRNALDTLRAEFELTMVLAGCRSIQQITREMLIGPEGFDAVLAQSRL